MLTLGDTSWYIHFSRTPWFWKEFDTSIWRYILYTYLYTNHRRRCSSKGANIELRRATLFFLCFLGLAEIRSRLPRGPMFEFILNSCGGGGCFDLQKHAKNSNYLLILLIVFLVKMFNWIRIVQARVASRSRFFWDGGSTSFSIFQHFVSSFCSKLNSSISEDSIIPLNPEMILRAKHHSLNEKVYQPRLDAWKRSWEHVYIFEFAPLSIWGFSSSSLSNDGKVCMFHRPPDPSGDVPWHHSGDGAMPIEQWKKP